MGGRKKGIEKEKDGGLETKFERAGGGEDEEVLVKVLQSFICAR